MLRGGGRSKIRRCGVKTAREGVLAKIRGDEKARDAAAGAHLGGKADPADILIIGAGASGAAVAWRLAEAGMRVLCLEQGGWVDPTEYPAKYDDWERRGLDDYHPDPNKRGLPEDYPINGEGTPLKPGMYNAVGGSTILWTSHFPRLHPSDFRVKTLDGVADDWPLTYEELEPFYDLNDRMVGVSGISGDPANPARSARQMPPLPLGGAGKTLAGAFDRLGWHWWPADAALCTRDYGAGRGACNHCGPCRIGCMTGAKASADITYWPAALAKGAVLKTHARVFEITVDDAGRATGAAYYDRDGVTHHAAARAVVVACNGIGTPRLMLLSKSKRFPDGIANGSGLVGRYLMHHPLAAVVGRFDQTLDSYKGHNTLTFASHEFYETDPGADSVRGFQLQGMRGFGPVMTAVGGWGVELPWGADHHAAFNETFSHTATLAILAEDLPDIENRVTLDAGLADSNGIPSPRLDYRIDANAEKLLARAILRSEEAFAEAGARSTTIVPLLPSALHLLGTARMGDDADHSVVDRWGRAHEVDNLFVVDGSVFVTAASANSTSTIQALALRTAQHMIDTRAQISVPG